MKTLIFLLVAVFAAAVSPLRASLLDSLVAANLGATSATVSFKSTDAAGAMIGSTAVVEWSSEGKIIGRTDEQFASGAKPGQPIAGLRAMYIEGLQPATNYAWRITVKSVDGTEDAGGGEFTTLPINPTSKRGPDGTHIPPYTPPYDTLATHIAKNWDEVNGLLKTCSGGEVIEVVEPDSGDKSLIVLTGGAGEWSRNVLIRPPLGSRASSRSRSVEINSPNITVAGFNLSGAMMYSKYGTKHPGNAEGIGARRAFFWMCALTRGGRMMANGSPDSGWYEVVALQRAVGGDRAQIKTYGNIVPVNFTIAGCWLEGRDRSNGKDHSDTLQTLGSGKTILGLRMIDSVFFRSANSCGQLTDLEGTLIQNCWFGPLSGRSSVCGSYYATLGACKGATIRDSDWNGSFRQDDTPEEISNSRFPKLKNPGKISSDNTIGGELSPQPPPPDMAAIWPR